MISQYVYSAIVWGYAGVVLVWYWMSWRAGEGILAGDGRTITPPDATGPARGRTGAVLWVAIGLWLLASLPLYACRARHAPNPDPFTYGLCARQVLQGERLYRDVLFDKGPLAAAIYMLPDVIAPRSYAAMSVFLGVCVALQAALFAWVFRGDAVMAFTGVVFLSAGTLAYAGFSWFSTEHAANFLVLGNVLLAYFIWRDGRFFLWQCFLAGALTCLAWNLRQPTLFSGGLPMLAVLAAPAPLKQKCAGYLCAAAGGIAALALVLALVMRIGDLQGYFHALFGGAGKYASVGSWVESARLLVGAVEMRHGALALVVLGMAMTGRYRLLALGAALFGLLIVVTPRRSYDHYFISLFPFILLAFGVLFDGANCRIRKLRWLTLVVVLVLFVPDALPAADLPATERNVASMRSAADAVDRLAPPGATISVFGPMTCEGVNYMSEHPTANKYWILWNLEKPLSTRWNDSLDEIFASYRRAPPGVIVIDAAYYSIQRDSFTTLALGSRPNGTRLMRQLMEDHPYTRIPTEADSDYVIFIRRESDR